MRIINLIPQREAKTVTSESYKTLIKQYMELRNFVVRSDSAVEGHLPDIILIHPYVNGRETWVESKWDEFSLFNVANRAEFIKYLMAYFTIPDPKNRFSLAIFTKHLSNLKSHEELSSDIDRATKLLNNIQKEAIVDQKIVIDSLTVEDFMLFLQDISIYIGNVEQMQIQILHLREENTSRSPIKGIERNIISKIENPPKLTGSEQIVGNFLKIGLKEFWGATIRLRDTHEIYDTIKNPPPFILYGGKLYSLLPFKRFNPFTQYIYPNSIIRVNPPVWMNNTELSRPLIWLINATMGTILYLKGVKFEKELKFHYCKKSNQIASKWMKEAGFRRDFVKEYKDGGYCRNLGVSARGFILDGEIFVQITPRKTFTSDGDQLLKSEFRKKKEEKFRKSQYSYNNNMLNDNRYWVRLLFDEEFVKNQRLGSSQNFHNRSIQLLRQIYRSISISEMETSGVNWHIDDTEEPIHQMIKEYYKEQKPDKKEALNPRETLDIFLKKEEPKD